MSLRATFAAWLAGLTNDDGSGTTGDMLNVAFFEDQMTVVDDAINSTGGMIAADVTYYVDVSAGSDVTGDGSVLNPWETLTHALDVLRPYRIQPGVNVTVQLADGTYPITTEIENLSPGITISGQNVLTRAVTSVQSSSGSAGNHAIILNVDDVSDITTSDYAIIYNASGGTLPDYLPGCWQITNVDAVNTRITVSTSHTNASRPSGAVAATLLIVKSSIFAIGVSGVTTAVTLKDVVLRGDGTASMYGVQFSTSSYDTMVAAGAVGVHGFGAGGFRIEYGCIRLIGSAVAAISNNAGAGIFAIGNSEISMTSTDTLVVSGNGGNGVSAYDNAAFRCSGSVISGNTGYGVYAVYGAVVRVFGGTLLAHATADIYAGKYAFVYAASATYTTVSPAVNTQGNEYGYIDT